MRAGQLRKRFVVERPRDARDEMGGVSQVWEAQQTVWGDLTPLRGLELERARQIEARLTHRISLRALPEMNPAWRLRLEHTARIFHPYVSSDVHERHRETEILAIEQVEATSGGTI